MRARLFDCGFRRLGSAAGPGMGSADTSEDANRPVRVAFHVRHPSAVVGGFSACKYDNGTERGYSSGC